MNKILVGLLTVISIVSIAALVISIVAIVQINKEDDDTVEEDLKFPTDFEFGAATSAYQIEGAWDADGKSPSIWDDAVHNHPNIINGNTTGDVAADSYNRYKEDVQLLKDSGFNFYRFSVSWSRVLPAGRMPNEAGIAYYNNLINELIANGIKPMITIYHWDLPSYVQQVGGWTNSLVVDYFEQYARLVFEKFGDRVKTFITFNEPYIFCEHGYGNGQDAPLIKSPGLGVYSCGHNVLLAHARAYRIYQAEYAATQGGKVGICLNSEFFWPDANTDAKLADQGLNHMLGWFAHPIFSKQGNYPQIMIDNIKRNSADRPWSRLPEFTAAEINSIKGSADFLAINYYSSRLVKAKANYPEEFDWEADAGIDRFVNQSWPRAKSSWLYNVPQGLHDLLVWIKDNYENPSVMIAENGYSDDGQIEDTDRVNYIKDHLTALRQAMIDGCNIFAYTVWSLLDNFEWLQGYTEHFGINHVDFSTTNKVRTPKSSSKYFKELISSRTI